MKTEIFVITHKRVDIPHVKGNRTLLVGAEKHSVDKKEFDYADSTGENISSKNPNYCEMTGVYWVWKNINDDIVGICHYRRFFSNAKFRMSSKYFLTDEDAENILRHYDVILPTCFHYSTQNINSSDAQIIPTINEYIEIKKALSILYPDYLEDFNSYLYGNSYYPYNMCVMRKELFDKYCEWIFNILFWIEKDYGVPYSDSYKSRLFGFISERILYVWIRHNISYDRIKEMRVVLSEENVLQSLRHTVSNGYRQLLWKIRNKDE